MKDLAAAPGVELLGVTTKKIGKKGERFSGDENSKGMAPQPIWYLNVFPFEVWGFP